MYFTFFLSDTKSVDLMVLACKRCARVLSRRPYVQSILVRYLIEGAVDRVS